MSQPKLTILGVYRPVISAETWKQQWEVTADDEFTREHFDKLVLIEAIVEGLSAPFEMDKFGQMAIDHPDEPERMMVGYDEGLLTPDGESLVQREMDCVQGAGPLRFAVYLHEYDSQRPLPVAVRGSNSSFYQGGAGEVSNAHAVHRVRLTPDGTRGRDEAFLNREYE